MNRTFRLLSGSLIFLAVLPGLSAQETITPLIGNPIVANDHRIKTGREKKALKIEEISLPLFDDFSTGTVVPDPEIWSDAFVFVNNSYGVDPVTNGVATLDAVDDHGSIYSNAAIDPNTFVADRLTSHPVMMDFPASDSIYLSFLYQPEGRGDRPEEQDSLLVDFYDPATEQWINVWGIQGAERHPFRHAMIPVTDERFLVEGFRFRFRNRASLPRNSDYPDKRSNVDHWPLDYIRLARSRFAADTVLRDVAFSRPLNSVLKDLTAIPWAHFESAYNTAYAPTIFGKYRNNDTIPRNVTRSMTIEEPLYNEIFEQITPTAQDLPAMEDTVVEFGFIYPLDFDRGDSAILRFRAALRTDEFDPKVNDTVIYDQVFKDYYAYDDGTAEAGYGLRGQGTRNSSVAMQYFAFEPDELGGVEVSFNQLFDSVNLGYYFKLIVWGDNDGVPGSIILEDENDYTVKYPSSYPGFHRYYFSRPVPVDGTFYVGWRQYNEFMLNVGLDLNNAPSPHVMFFNYRGIWETSKAPGVMLFRPFLYDETTRTDPRVSTPAELRLFPNPASDLVSIQAPDPDNSEFIIDIFDSSGRLVDHLVTGNRELNVSGLPAGIYYLKLNSGSSLYYTKLLINR